MYLPQTALAIALAAALSGGCNRGAAKPSDKKGPGGGRAGIQFPVEVAPVEQRKVDYVVTGVGSIAAFETVQVTARVAGVVEQVRFAEGDIVKKGAPLVEIEVQRYDLALRSARASLARAQAAQREAEQTAARREAGVAEGIASAEELEAARARLGTATADVRSAEAAVALAALNLRDAKVTAPVAGTIQTRTVQTGQYVQPGAVLATLVQRDPLLLRFQVTEQEASRLPPGARASFRVRGIDRRLEAEITSVADAADPTTRMVPIVGRIVEPIEELRPGAFAEVTIAVGAAHDAPVIPQTAVRPSERGFLSFVVEDGKAKERVLELGMRTAEGLVEVRKGLRPGEQLVVRGAEALSEGSAVRVVASGAPQPQGSAAPGASSAPERAP